MEESPSSIFNRQFIYLLNLTLQKTGDTKIGIYLRDIRLLTGNEPNYLVEIIGPILFRLKDDIARSDHTTFLDTVPEDMYEVSTRTNKEDVSHCVRKIQDLIRTVSPNKNESGKLQQHLMQMCKSYALYEKGRSMI